MTDGIIHRDDRLLVLEKPSGLLAVPGRGPDLQDCLAARVQRVMPTARVVHRLDRDTSGLMLMALDADAQRELSRQFEARTVRKTYQCVVRGVPAADEGLVDLPIARDPLRPPRYRIDEAAGRPSQTRWRVLGRGRDPATSLPIAWLGLEPLTGRTHQLRVHCAAQGWPILGDAVYGIAPRSGGPPLHLHAREVTIPLPRDAPVRVVAPVPAHMRDRLLACGLNLTPS